MNGWPDELQRLRALDPRRRGFGALEHAYALRPPLGEDGVSAVERKYGVRLPEPYRTFVRDVGSGGAGPGFGLFPPDVRGEDEIGDDIGTSDLPLLATPFDAGAAFGLTVEDADEDDDEAVERTLADYCDARWTAGAMYLNHYGCALRALIVVTGPLAGRIIFDRRTELGGIVPFDGTQARIYHDDDAPTADAPYSFEAWYER